MRIIYANIIPNFNVEKKAQNTYNFYMNDTPPEPPKAPHPDNQLPILKQIEHVASNLALALLFTIFFFQFLNDFLEHEKFSSLLFLIKESFLVLFFLTRMVPEKTSYKPYDWLIALAGTWAGLLFIPVESTGDNIFLFSLQCFGILIAITGIACLNRSFGIVPALRGVKTGGLYKYIRHPVYLGYLISFTAITLQNPHIWNVTVLIGIAILDVLRIFSEEKFMGQDEEYQAYMARTKYRLLPYIW